MKKRIFLCVMVGGMLGFLVARVVPLVTEKEKSYMKRDSQGYVKVENIQDVYAVYPKTVEEIIARSEYVQKQAAILIQEILTCPQDHLSKDTVLGAYDKIMSYVQVERSILELVKMVYVDDALRQEAEKQYVILQNFLMEHVESNKALYEIFSMYEKTVAPKESLSPEEIRFLKIIMDDFKRAGLALLETDRLRVLELRKRCSELESTFQRLVSEDDSKLIVSKEQLAGIDEAFIASLPKEGDLYVLAMNYPIQSMVMSYCTNQETRKAYYKLFANRAYPANVPVLEELIAKRNEFAKLLGFESYAQYDLANQMVKTPERAWEFENNLLPRALEKSQHEFTELTEHLPEGVQLTSDGKLERWNSGYVSTYFKKKKYSIDEHAFAEYFPMQSTIAGLISIYEKFFSVQIESVPVQGMWHEDVQLLQVSKKDTGRVCGYVFLDMFPRQKKYGHAAQFDGVRSLKRNGQVYPCVVTLVCNFTKPLGEKPSLLQYDEVNTFFHEFGHAMHSVLGATQYLCQAGTSTEVDFVELPSQMLENWIEEKDILKMISRHYKTGEPLPDDLIEKRLELLKYGTGMHVARQIGLGMMSLAFFGPEEQKELDFISKKYGQLCAPYLTYDTDTHWYCSFGHLMGYGARYYGYLWSLALGCDVFEAIKEQGLLNPEIGKKYINDILGRGGSADANDMLKDFLGREPQYDAFYKKMGF